MSNKDLVTLIQFRPAFGLSSGSPYCLKVETFLRMAGIEYEIEIQDMPQKAPKGKLPVIRHKDQTIADSREIISYLAEQFPKAAALTKLKKANQALGHAIRCLLEDHLYFCMVYFRWVDETNWKTTSKVFFAHLPLPISLIVPGIARKAVIRQLHEQGLGRHSREQIAERAIEDLQALEVLTGKSGYILGGSKASVIDATAFGTLAQIYFGPTTNPLREYLIESKRLMGYLRTMRKAYFSELAEI